MTIPAVDPRPSITCPECQRTSWHPQDVAQGYCGYCHWWTSDPVLGMCPPPRDDTGPAPRRGPGRWWRRVSR